MGVEGWTGVIPPVAATESYASWAQRAGAWLVDAVIVWGGIWGASTAVAILLEDAAAGIGLFLLLAFFSPFYYAFFHAGARGQTPGKRTNGIAVRSVKTLDRLSLWRALARAYFVLFLWLMVWSALPLILDSLWPLWDPKRQAWHDKLVGSVVVRLA